MYTEIPQYALKAYALFFSRHDAREEFKQSELDWIVSQSMKKKIFALLLKASWIRKVSGNSYRCERPDRVITGLLDFKVPEIMQQSSRKYAFTGMSAIEIWSDYSYIQRGTEKSPYFIKVLKKDVQYWKTFFRKHRIPVYIGSGSTIGEYVILVPADKFKSVERGGLCVEGLKRTMHQAKSNDIYSYAYNHMRNKYGAATKERD